MDGLLYTIAISFVGLLLYLIVRPRYPEVINHWSLYFTDRQFSTKEFYDKVENILTERKAPELQFKRVDFLEKGFFSHYREYCRIRFGNYTFDICAAPYGTGYFTSWWFGEDIPIHLRILYLLPFIGKYFKIEHSKKTYHIADTESMFQAAVHQAVLDTIEQLSAGKGLRALNDTDTAPKRVRGMSN